MQYKHFSFIFLSTAVLSARKRIYTSLKNNVSVYSDLFPRLVFLRTKRLRSSESLSGGSQRLALQAHELEKEATGLNKDLEFGKHKLDFETAPSLRF